MRLRARRRSYGAPAKRKKPWIIVAACVLSAVLITVVVGNLLKVWLSDEAYQSLLGEDTTTAPADEPQKPVSLRKTKAEAYLAGDDLLNLSDRDVSLSINTPDGSAWYPSEVAEYFGIPTLRKESLSEIMPTLCGATAFVSCVYYPQAFDAESEELFFAKTGTDCALIREWIVAGGNEVLLCDIPFDRIDRIATYVQTLREAIGKDVPIGIAIPIAKAQETDAWEMISELARVCDFLALDLRDSDVPLSDCGYYVEQYGMRPLLLDTQEDAASYARQNLDCFEIVTPPPTP